MIPKAVQTEITEILQLKKLIDEQAPFAIEPLLGGDINQVYQLRFRQLDCVVKLNYSSRYPGMFDAEATALKAIRACSCIPVPEIYGTGEAENVAFIILEHIKKTDPKDQFWEQFGRNLASLHQNTSNRFGWSADNFIGTLHQSNTLHKNWSDFFIQERLKPQVDLAQRKRHLAPELVAEFEELYQVIPHWFPNEPPALLHGDLWNGNFLSGPAGATIIDPASYYGFREMDLAMSRLFGGFQPEFYHAYHETYPLKPGWEMRVELCNLYPIMVHLNLFGTSYLPTAAATVRKYITLRPEKS